MVNIKAGIVGLGFMGRRYAEFLHKLHNVEVSAVCDIRTDVAEEVAQLTGAQVFAEAEALATSPDVDAVFICTPEDKHLSATLAAIHAGKAVMIEKPVTHSLESAQEINEVAEAKGALVMVGHLLRFEPRWAAAKRVIAGGDLGDVVSIATRRVGNVADQNILKGRTTIPLYYGVHDLDIVRWFAGAEATTIFASRRSGALQALGYPIHDLYTAVLEFENNILATAELGWHVPFAAVAAPTTGISVVGTKGWLKIEQGDTGLQFWSEDGQSGVHPIIDVTFWPEVHHVPSGALANELSHFLDCVRDDSPPVIGLKDGYEALRLSLAMEASADQQAVIHLADFA